MSYTETSPRKNTQTPIVQVEELEVCCDGFKAITDMNFSLEQGELRFLTGPKGAGKTTLLDVLCGQVKPSKGKVLFKGQIDLTSYQEHQIPPLGIARKSRAPLTFAALTVQENLLLSMRQKRGLLSTLVAKTTQEQRSRLHDILELIGLADKAKERAGLLPYSEKQRLEIGMLLIREPELLLLEKPAAGLSGSEMEKTGELLRRISGRQTIVVVEQDMEFIRRFAHTVTVMQEGKVLREGTIQDIHRIDPEKTGEPRE